MLSPSRLGSQAGRWGRYLLQVAVTDSTNRLLLDWGRRFPQPLPVGTVLVSTRQRAGQGQHGRVWHSQPGGGCTCPFGWDPRPCITRCWN